MPERRKCAELIDQEARRTGYKPLRCTNGTGALMSLFTDQSDSAERQRAARPTAGTTLPQRGSLVQALRHSGLLLRAAPSEQIAVGWAESPDLWVAVISVYESHLRRALMDQAFALLRAERGAADGEIAADSTE